MSAVTSLARAEARNHRVSLVFVAVLVAVVVAAVLGALNGWARTATVGDRYLRSIDAPAATVGIFAPEVANDTGFAQSLAVDVAAAAGADTVIASHGVFVVIPSEVEYYIDTSIDPGHLEAMSGQLVEGRMPVATAETELAVGAAAAATLGVRIGDRIAAGVPNTSQIWAEVEGVGPIETVRNIDFLVVGILRTPSDLSPGGTSEVLGVAAPAFAAQLGDGDGDVGAVGLTFRLWGDIDDGDRLAAQQVLPLQLPESVVYGSLTIDDEDVQPFLATADTVANSLLVFAAVAAVGGLLAIWLAVARHLGVSWWAARAGSAIGFTRRQLSAGAALPVIAVSVMAVAVGIVGALAVSGLFPISVARTIEPDSGLWWDAWVLLAGVVAALVALGAVVVLVAFRQSRAALWEPAVMARASGSQRGRRRLPLPMAGAIGIGSVVRRDGFGRVSSTLAVVGAALAVAVAVAASTVMAGQRTTVADSDRWGISWDVEANVYVEQLTNGIDGLVDEMAADPRVTSVGGYLCQRDLLPELPVPACTVLGFAGGIGPIVASGVAPTGPDDIALGANTAEQAGVGVGDVLTLSTPERQRDLQVVGIVVGPGSPTPGDTVLVSPEVVTQLGSTSELYELDGKMVLDLTDGLDVDETLAGLTADHPIAFTADAIATPPVFLQQLQRLRPVFFALVAFVAVLGAAGMLHFLVLSVARRRRETAVLQSLGFVRRQVRVVIGWQAAAVAVLGICIGVPSGLVIGRWVWLALVDHLGIIDTPAVPWAALVVVPIAVLLGAGVLATAPAWRAARVRPCVGLRGE